MRRHSNLLKEQMYLRIRILIYLMLLSTIVFIVFINLNVTMETSDLPELKPVKVETVTEPAKVAVTVCYPLTDAERYTVERVVAAEARGETIDGMMGVAQTIRDRSQLWNKNVIEIATADGQFANPYTGEISEEVKLSVTNVFDYGQSTFSEPVTHFYSGSDVPYWVEGKVNRGSAGRHKFYY